MKIKLVAIAKDEAAYLPEWIFHHLHFGFDEIEIYVNFTTDDSQKVLEKIEKNYPVKYKNAEYLLAPESDKYDHLLREKYFKRNKLQSRAYAEALHNARAEGFTHIMYLDIDEFWTPYCFSKTIKQVLNDLSDPETLSFHWKNKVRDNKQFSRPFQNKIYYLNKPQLKSVTKIEGQVTIMNSHFSTYIAYGSNKKINPEEKNIADDNKIAFILHRFQRSEAEYISMLGRGDATYAGTFNLKFTRSGFLGEDIGLSMTFNTNLIGKYDQKYQKFIKNNKLKKEIENAKEFVLAQNSTVLGYIKNNIKTYNIIQKITPGLTLDKETQEELNRSQGLSDKQINTLRDIALQLESNDLQKAYELMEIAYTFKPQGPLIKMKFMQYKNALDKQ